MKKGLSVLLVVCLLLALSSCGQSLSAVPPGKDAEWKNGSDTAQYDETDIIPESDKKSGNEGQIGPPTLKAEGPLRLAIGDGADLLKGITAKDFLGNDIIDRVKWETNAKFSGAGEYLISYNVSDAFGNTAVLDRMLIIHEPAYISLYNSDEAKAIVRASADSCHVMGISVAVIENGQIVDTITCGDAVYKKQEMTVDTKIRIASISKLGIAFAAAKLYDEGLLDPYEDIGTYWGADIYNPRYPDTPITIRDILCHTSSMRNNDEDYRLGVERTLNQLTSGSVFSCCEPGKQESFMYNNYAFGVLGVTLELICGEVLDTYLKENIFNELGIEASYSTATLDKEELASLYDASWSCTRSVEHMATRPVYTEPGYYIWYYAGNLTISAGDLAKLVTVLINDGMYEDKRILSEKAVALLEEPQFTAKDEIPMEFTQCLPLRFRSGMYGREELFYHTGSAFGVFSLMCYDPKSGDGVVVITTGASTVFDEYGVTTACGDIAEAILNMLDTAE